MPYGIVRYDFNQGCGVELGFEVEVEVCELFCWRRSRTPNIPGVELDVELQTIRLKVKLF